MANINSLVRRWENGGTITIATYSAGSPGTADTILNVEKGTLRFTPGLEEPIEYADRSALNTSPLAGDERPTEVEIEVKCTKTFSVSGELYQRLTAAAASGTVPKFQIVCQFPNFKGDTAGESVTFNHCIVAPGGVQYQATGDIDKLMLKFRSMTARPTCATY